MIAARVQVPATSPRSPSSCRGSTCAPRALQNLTTQSCMRSPMPWWARSTITTRYGGRRRGRSGARETAAMRSRSARRGGSRPALRAASGVRCIAAAGALFAAGAALRSRGVGGMASWTRRTGTPGDPMHPPPSGYRDRPRCGSNGCRSRASLILAAPERPAPWPAGTALTGVADGGESVEVRRPNNARPGPDRLPVSAGMAMVAAALVQELRGMRFRLRLCGRGADPMGY